jgi:hypothetical protein
LLRWFSREASRATASAESGLFFFIVFSST